MTTRVHERSKVAGPGAARRGLWLAFGLVAACYNPKFDSGTLRCGVGFKCPSGYYCSMIDLTCWQEGHGPMPTDGGGTGGVGGMGGAGGTGGRGGAGGGGMCYTIPNCSGVPGGGACDPVCQMGCPCGQRCNLATNSMTGATVASCIAQAPPFLGPGGSCESRGDSCQPGLICLTENAPACGAHCYRYCRSDEHCGPNARCVIGIDTGPMTPAYMACSPPVDNCDPTGNARCGALRPNYGCYILSARYAELTVCDCAGLRALNEACQGEHDCQPGLECIREAGAQVCRKVCQVGALAGTPAGCPVGTTCQALPVSGGPPRFGWCRR